MINRTQLVGNWNQIQGKIRERWDELSEDDLKRVKGDVDQLIGVIQQKTGETRSRIERFLNEMAQSGETVVGEATEAAREYAHHATEAVHDTYEHVADGVRTGYIQAEGAVRRNPFESVAVAFGAGLISGVVVSLLLKR